MAFTAANPNGVARIAYERGTHDLANLLYAMELTPPEGRHDPGAGLVLTSDGNLFG